MGRNRKKAREAEVRDLQAAIAYYESGHPIALRQAQVANADLQTKLDKATDKVKVLEAVKSELERSKAELEASHNNLREQVNCQVSHVESADAVIAEFLQVLDHCKTAGPKGRKTFNGQSSSGPELEITAEEADKDEFDVFAKDSTNDKSQGPDIMDMLTSALNKLTTNCGFEFEKLVMRPKPVKTFEAASVKTNNTAPMPTGNAFRGVISADPMVTDPLRTGRLFGAAFPSAIPVPNVARPYTNFQIEGNSEEPAAKRAKLTNDTSDEVDESEEEDKGYEVTLTLHTMGDSFDRFVKVSSKEIDVLPVEQMSDIINLCRHEAADDLLSWSNKFVFRAEWPGVKNSLFVVDEYEHFNTWLAVVKDAQTDVKCHVYAYPVYLDTGKVNKALVSLGV